MSGHARRLARLERAALAATPRRIVVIWPDEPEPEPDALGPRDVVLRVVYESGPVTEPADLPADPAASRRRRP